MSARVPLHERFARAALAVLTALTACIAGAADATLTLLWSVPQPGVPLPAPLTLEDATSPTQGALALLARERAGYVVLAGGGAAGPGIIGHSEPAAVLTRIVGGGRDLLWVGGRVGQRAFGSGADVPDAYLMKLNHEGRLAGEYVFHSGRPRAIEDLFALPAGEVLLSGRDGNEAWLAKISAAGALVWQQRFGLGKGSAVIALGNRILVAAIDVAQREDKRYQEDLTVWSFDATGKPLDKQLVRPGLADMPTSQALSLALLAAGDAAYVVSSSADLVRPRPLQVSRVRSNGSPVGYVTLEGSIAQRDSRSTALCEHAQVVLENGDLLVACASDALIRLYRLAASDGAVTESSVALPQCHKGRAPALFLFKPENGTVWLLGSHKGGTLGAGCTWLGVLALS